MTHPPVAAQPSLFHLLCTPHTKSQRDQNKHVCRYVYMCACHTNIRSSLSLCHPLTRRPESFLISCGQTVKHLSNGHAQRLHTYTHFNCTKCLTSFKSVCVCVRYLYDFGSSISHGQWAGVKTSRRCIQVQLTHLIHTTTHTHIHKSEGSLYVLKTA